jgi:type III secretion system YscQ/HrcQ family protein
MNPTPDSEKLIADDPFAADIFATATGTPDDDADAEAFEFETASETGKIILWSESLPRVSRSAANWDELLRRLPPVFYEEMPRRLADSLARLLNFPDEETIEFSTLGKREINRAEDFAAENGWWLTVGTTATVDEAEIYFAFDDALAVRLIDAALFVNEAENSGGIISRSLSPTEIAILEFFALNLTHEANRVLQLAQFRFRAVGRQIPRSLERIFESDSFSLLALNGQIFSTDDLLPPSDVKIFLAPEALQSLPVSGNLQSNRRLSTSQNLPNQIKTVRARLFCGDARLYFGEIAALETGDVVLLENQQFSINGENIVGRAEIFLGDGNRQKINGSLSFSRFADAHGGASFEENGSSIDNKIPVRRINFNGSPQIAIESFAAVEAAFPDEFMIETNDNLTNPNALTDGGETADENAGEEQGGLSVENLHVALRVELEARRLTVGEVGNLHENQTLELGIRPTDEVNILIDDRVVGRGELVAVEDRLGVRITKLMR